MGVGVGGSACGLLAGCLGCWLVLCVVALANHRSRSVMSVAITLLISAKGRPVEDR